MNVVPPGPDAVRAYLDSAVAEAAERWVGRAADATAYADLVAAVLARREALAPLAHLPAQAGEPLDPIHPGPRHFERRARARWPLHGQGVGAVAGTDMSATEASPHTPVPARRAAPFIARVEARPGSGLPSRPPGRHRLPPPEDDVPRAIDLSENLSTVLDWLGRPDA